MQDPFLAVDDFNRNVLGNPLPSEPTLLTRQQIDRLKEAVNEELDELSEATTLEDQFDALLDAEYFIKGRVAEMGLSKVGTEAFLEVHRANMEKKAGTLAKRNGWNGNDAVKPVHWTPPQLERLIRLASPTAKPRVLVLGYGRHGKDTVADMLVSAHNLKQVSSSLFCAERVLMPYFNSLPNHPGYASVEECFEDRHTGDNRAIWYGQIQAYNYGDQARLAREMLEVADLYVGMRAAPELEAAHSLFDWIVWVERPGLPPEDESSMTITKEQAKRLAGYRFTEISNHGTLDYLNYAVLTAYLKRFHGEAK